MSHDEIVRTAAVVAAVALLAAPYRQQITWWLATATEAAKQHGSTLGRIAAALLILAAAWGKLPMPTLPEGAAPRVVVDTPSPEMQSLVAPIAAAAKFNAADRATWAQTWTKAGVVVAGDAVTTEVVLRDTCSLRDFTALALDIAWRRIGQHQPGSNEPLRQAVEAAYAQVLGKDVVPVTADLRARYVELAKAIAWAGTR